jgi:hypothetical protein
MPREQIEAIFERVRTWPENWQENVAATLLAMERDYRNPRPYVPSVEDRVEIEAALAEMERGEFATDEEVAAAFRRNR